MRSEHQDIERIEAFVERRMSDAERRAFEERLEGDDALMNELHAYRTTRKALVDVFADQHQHSATQRNVVKLPPASKRTWAWATAASAALLLNIGGWYFFSLKTSLPELAERYAVHESSLPVLMSAPLEHRNALDKPMQLFGAGRYDQALAEFDLLPTSDTVAFYAGLCAQEKGEDPTARFQTVLYDANSIYRAKTLYHLMLWYMDHDRPSDAARLLTEQLRMVDHPYHLQLETLASNKAMQP